RPKVSNRPLKINDLGQFCQTEALKLTLFNSVFADADSRRAWVCATNHDYQSKRREAADRGSDGVRARIAHPANSPSRSKCVKVAAGGASKIRPLDLRDFSDGRVPCRHLGCRTVIAAARFIGAPRHRWPHASAILAGWP